MPNAIFGFSKWLLLLLMLVRTAVAAETSSMDAEAYNNRGIAYYKQGQNDQAISDYTKALEINPRYAEAYSSRAYAYYYLKDYGRAWDDLYKAQKLGAKIDAGFLKNLREASGREK